MIYYLYVSTRAPHSLHIYGDVDSHQSTYSPASLPEGHRASAYQEFIFPSKRVFIYKDNNIKINEKEQSISFKTGGDTFRKCLQWSSDRTLQRQQILVIFFFFCSISSSVGN
jgi:hypothetical protein